MKNKFDVGERVFFHDGLYLCYGKIRKISSNTGIGYSMKTGDSQEIIMYEIDSNNPSKNDSINLSGDKLFKSFEDLLASLKDG